MVRAASRSNEIRRVFRVFCLSATRSGVFAFFGQDDGYFPPAQKAMINLQVDDLNGVLDRLRDEGVAVDPKRENCDFGKFGWFTNPQGNRVELWQPVATD